MELGTFMLIINDFDCRETADEKKVQDAHKKLMILNHPDAGGSTFLATKVNEAKELLIGGSSGTS